MTQNSAPTSLFSPEQMAEIQKNVQDRLAQDYRKNNFIPVADSIPANLYKQVNGALSLGLTKYPQDALFFDPQYICTIAQISAPTMFVVPGIAADIDKACFATMHHFEGMRAALANYVGMKYDMAPNGQSLEKPDTNETVQAMLDLRTATGAYAASILRILGALSLYYRGDQINDGYREAALITHIFSEEPSQVNRDEFRTDFLAVLGLEPPHHYTVPARLGLDVLQLLAYLAETTGSQLNDTQFAALMVTFGNKVVNISPSGEIIIDPEHVDTVRATLAPHRKWLAEFMPKAEKPQDEIAMVYYPAEISPDGSDGKMIYFHDFGDYAKCSETPGPNEVIGALKDVITKWIALGRMTLPVPSAAVSGNLMIGVEQSFIDDLLDSKTNKVAEPEETSEPAPTSEVTSLFYPAKIVTLDNDGLAITFRDLCTTVADLTEDTPEERTEVLMDVLVDFMVANSSADATNKLVPMPTAALEGEVLIELPADRVEIVQKFNARVLELSKK